jgi:hypothetical protein
MGRILDLFAEVAAAAEEGPEGLLLLGEDRARIGEGWQDEDLDDALALVRETLLHGELVEAADSVNARLLELLGELGEAAAFGQARAGEARLTLDAIAQLTRRVARLEEVLEVFRDGAPPDRRGFDSLRGRLADLGIEHEMAVGDGHDEPEE